MKPVELEIIMRDSTRQGMQSVERNITGMETQMQEVIGILKKELAGLQNAFKDALSRGVSTSSDLADIQALKGKIVELEEELKKLKTQAEVPVKPNIDLSRYVTDEIRAMENAEARVKAIIANIQLSIDSLRNKSLESASTGVINPKDAAEIKALEAQIRSLTDTLGKYDASKRESYTTPVIDEQATMRQTNNLKLQFSQVARELPALAMGPQMFILAISNNLPMLADAVKSVREQNELLAKSNQKTTSVWRQLLSAAGSWQTMLVVGITLLTVYGREIGEWFSSFSKGKKGIDVATESLKGFHKAMTDGEKNAQKDLTRLNLLYNASINSAKGTDERKRAVLELKKEYPDYFGKLDEETILLGNAKTAYDKLSASILATAKARAAEEVIGENSKKRIGLNNQRIGFLVKQTQAQRRLDNEKTLLNNLKGNPEAYDFQLKTVEIARKEVEEYGAQAAESARQIELLNKMNEQLAKEINIDDLLDDNNNKKPLDKTPDNYQDKLADARIRAQQKIDETFLSLEAEGAKKKRAQAALDFEQEKERIKREETERLALYESAKKAGMKVDENEPQIIRRQADAQKVLAGVVYDEKINKINDDETKGKLESFEKLLKPYRDFAKQRLDIEKQYDDDIARLQKEKENAAGDAGKEKLISDAIVVAEEEKANAVAELDRVFAEKDVNFQAFMNHLGDMSLTQLQTALTNAEKALNDSTLKNGKDSKQTAVARAKVKALKDEISFVKADNEAKAPDDLAKWNNTSNSVKKCKRQIDDMISSMDGLDESTKAALQTASNVADGAIGMIDGIKKLSVSAGESISAVEKASIILAIVGAAIQIMTAIFSMSSAAEKRHQEALAEVAANKLSMQREYNLLLLQQNLLMKEATTAFGEKEIAKAANAVKVYRDAIQQYKDTLKGEVPTLKFSIDMKGLTTYIKQKKAFEKGIGGLSDVSVKTGHKKTGVFGWGKGKDIYSSVLDVYPDLIDAENKLNIERAKTIISTQTMSDESKNLLQNLIDLQEQADEAQESLRDYLQDTFGGLGEGILDSITDAIQSGTDAWENFGDKGAEVLENLGRQIMYSLFFADKFAKLQKDLEKIYGSDKSEEEIAKDAMNLVGDFYDNIGKDMDAAEEFAKNWQEEAAKRGFELWKPKEGSSQSGHAGGITTVTEETAGKLEGIGNSIQTHVISMDDKLTDISQCAYDAIGVLGKIAENTEHCKRLEEMADDIAGLRRDGLKIKG